jgi:hypothetical protein
MKKRELKYLKRDEEITLKNYENEKLPFLE